MDSFRPLVRFAGFGGEWKKVRLGDMFDIGNGYTPSKNVPQFWTNGTIPWFRMEDIRENGRILKDSIQHVTKEAVKSTGLFPANSIIISTTATIGEHALLIADSLANQRFSFLVRKLNRIDSMDIMFIFYHCFLLGDWCRSKSNAGGLLAVNMEDLRNYYFSLPSLPEQQKISEYFTEIDRAISLQTQKLSKLKQIKAASLQNMFPQEGQMLPKVRFAGFEGEWERVRLGEMFDRLKHNSLSRAELCDEGEIANIHYGDVLIHYGECIDTTKDNLTYIKDEKLGNSLLQVGALRKGDVIFADAAEDNTVGKCSELICNESEQIVSGLHTIACRPLFPFAERYLGYCLNSPSYHNQLLPLIQGTKVSSISFKSLSQTLLLYPHDYKEQQTIANYFTKLDRKIELETQKLEKLKQIKSACLSKMFV